MSIRIIYFVHGTTIDNEKGLTTGQLPGELSQKGKRQSQELGEALKDQRFDAVFCSDLARAVESAQIGFGDRCTIISDKRLREIDYGDLTQHLLSQVRPRMKEFIDVPFPNGESYRDVERRTKDFLQFLKKEYDGKDIAVVAHQGPQLALDVIARGRTWAQAINEDWRLTGSWQPGWEYKIE